MLSTKVVGNVSDAKHYFLGHDNYYSEEQSLAEERSSWWGKGAESLGLEGTIDGNRFTELLQGKISENIQVCRVVDGEIQHRPGFDLTFSVPKSVSLAALMGKDDRILKAIEKATDKSLSMIEKNHAQARVTKDGLTEYVPTGNLVVARFLHDFSREADPQLHTHCVVMNLTQRADGEWRSLASEIGDYSRNRQSTPDGFIEAVRYHKKYYGMIFRAELAYELKQLGYQIERTGDQEFFELAGISAESIKAYSQRRKEIEAYLEEKGFTGAKAAAVATLNTRQKKEDISRENLQVLWKAKEELHGVNTFLEAEKVVAESLAMSEKRKNPIGEISQNDFQQSDVLLKRAINDAILHLSEHQVVLRENEIIHQTLQYLSKPASISKVMKEIQLAQKEGALIPLPQDDREIRETYFTTPTLLRYEREILDSVLSTDPHQHAMLTQQKLNSYLSNREDLTKQQRQALLTLFSSKNQVMLLAGSSGSGKTHLIEPMMTLGQMAGYRPILLTPGKHENLQLAKEIQNVPKNLRDWMRELLHQKKFETVSGFLFQQERDTERSKGILSKEVLFYQKPLVIVDRAGILSSKEMLALQTHVARLGGRCIAIDDPDGQQGWKAGSPFQQMLKHGALAARLTENYRTQTPELKEAIKDTLASQINTAFSRVGHRILSIESKENRLAMMAEHYVHLPKYLRENTLLCMPNKTSSEELTTFVRDSLKAMGELSPMSALVETLQPRSLTEVQHRYAKHYQTGQMVRFNDNFVSLGVSRGEYRTIHKVDDKNNVVFLKSVDGQLVSWQPDKVASNKVELFDVRTKEITVGETLVLRRSDKTKGIYSGERLKTLSVTKETMILQKDNGKKVALDLGNPSDKHLDYSYVSTPFQKTTQTPHTIIAYQNSYGRQTNQRAFYQLLGKAKEQAWIYTESKDCLLRALQEEGGKTTAIDALLRESVLEKSNGWATHQQAQAQAHIVLLKRAVEKALTDSRESLTPEGTAERAVRYALKHLSEKETSFSHKEVLETALKHVFGEANQELITKATERLIEQGEIIQGICSRSGEEGFTTREALTKEKAILEMAMRDRNLIPLVSKENITRYLNEHAIHETLGKEHEQVLRGICSQQNRLCIVQGHAGTGKTTVLRHLNTMISIEDKQLLCLAPTHSAVKEIRGHGLEAKTLDQFVADYKVGKLKNDLSNTLIVVDEASMISNHKQQYFLTILHGVNARGVLMGDTRQYASIASGKPTELLQKAGVETFTLTKINRQKDDTLKTSVSAVYQKEFEKVFQILEKHIKEVDTQALRLEQIRDDYLSRDPVRRANTMIITLGNADRVMQNALINEGLKQEGTLLEEALRATVLTPQHLNEIERTQAIHYQEKDVLRFNVADPALGIEKGQYYDVKEVHKAHNLLVLQKDNQPPIAWKTENALHKNDGSKVEIYRKEERDIHVGELIRWTRTDKEMGLLNPELAMVTRVDQDGMEVRPVGLTDKGIEPKGESLYLTNQNPRFQHFDYAYAMTGYSSQGKGISEVIVHAESSRTCLVSQRAFLVILTRAIYGLTIYTDNKEKLLGAILGNEGKKESALETVNAFPYDKAHINKAPEPLTKSQKNQKILKIQSRNFEQKKTKKTHNIQHGLPLDATKRHPTLDAKRIHDLLKDRTEEVVKRLLGEPKSRDGSQYRYGTNKGSFIVSLQGEKRGLWHDFETGEGGNLLSLVAKQYGLNVKTQFKDVLEEAVCIAGTSINDPAIQSHGGEINKNLQKNDKQSTHKLTESQKKSLNYATKLARESKPILGTLAERYLKEHRNIDLKNFPENIRFHSGIYSQKNEGVYPTLLVVAKDENKKITAVQAIFLDEKTAQKANVALKKQTWGQPSKANVILKKDAKNERTYLAEGPETALSIYVALGNADVRITLGKANFKNINPEKTGKDVVLCLDNDGKNLASEKLIQFAAEHLIYHQKNVLVAMPDRVGQDYNDMLKIEGLTTVKQAIENAIPYQNYYEKMQEISLHTCKREAIKPIILRYKGENSDKSSPKNDHLFPINWVDIIDNKTNKIQLNNGKIEVESKEVASVKSEEFKLNDTQKIPDKQIPQKIKELEL